MKNPQLEEEAQFLDCLLEAARDRVWERMLEHNVANLSSKEPEIRARAAEALASGLDHCSPRVAEKIRAKLRQE